MPAIKILSSIILLLVSSLGKIIPEVQAQDGVYKFPITQEGIYKITSSQAASLGVASVNELSVFGYNGMLPQQLDSSSWDLKEIPVKEIDGDLYFYLSAASTIDIEEAQGIYLPHHYADTLYYLLQTNRKYQVEIASNQRSASSGHSEAVLYQVHAYKNEVYNLLSSGRQWYGERAFNGDAIILNYTDKTTNDLPLYFRGNFMAQALSESTFQLSLNQKNFGTITIPPISNSTYGIKGHEKLISGWMEPSDSTSPLQVRFNFQTADKNGTGYLDYFILGLPFPSTTLPSGIFYNFNNDPFELKPLSQQVVWDISDFFEVKEISLTTTGPHHAKKIAVFTTGEVTAVSELEQVQLNLRKEPKFTDLIIISHPSLKSQAERLAAHKNTDGISTQVVTLPEIYDSFGYGTRDITAIRNFLAFHYHGGRQLKHVLLFGKGTFDYKNKMGGRPNLVPTYSSRSSLNPLTTYSSDDYYGFLEYGEGNWEEHADGDHDLEIGVGRLPVINPWEASNVVEKIIQYTKPASSLGDWKRKVLFVADDGDNNVHLNDSESLATYLSDHHPELILEKLYLDSFAQEKTGSGQKSPAAKAAFETLMDSSMVLVNYIGHGNETNLMAEDLFTVSDLNNWRENPRLPVFITATCEFGRHDSPFIRSGAEELLTAPGKGAIAMLSTGRPVFSNINFSLNQAFIKAVFEKENGKSLTLGEIFKRTKNNSLNGPLNRNFSLLGDPSLPLASPELSIEVDMNPGEVTGEVLKSLQPIRYKGRVMDPVTGNTQDSYNGWFQILLSDRPGTKMTLGDESNPAPYFDEHNYLYRGRGKVVNGQVDGELILPHDSLFSTREGKIVFFAMDAGTGKEAFGAEKILLDGASSGPPTDHQGPTIFLSTEESIDQISSKTVKLIADLSDPSGIKIDPSAPREGITVSINNGEKTLLNDYYTATEGSFTKGTMEFKIRNLEEGLNVITLEASDNLGNRTSKTIDIFVKGSNKLMITSHHTFPNPASEVSNFLLKHNMEGKNLLLRLKVFSFSGKEIYSISRRFPKADPVLDDLTWIFMQSKTKYPAKGTYLYVLELIAEKDGYTDQKAGKIIIR